MKLEPVKNYEDPKYSSFNLKNGKILPAGIAILTACVAISVAAHAKAPLTMNLDKAFIQEFNVFAGLKGSPDEQFPMFFKKVLTLDEISKSDMVVSADKVPNIIFSEKDTSSLNTILAGRMSSSIYETDPFSSRFKVFLIKGEKIDKSFYFDGKFISIDKLRTVLDQYAYPSSEEVMVLGMMPVRVFSQGVEIETKVSEP